MRVLNNVDIAFGDVTWKKTKTTTKNETFQIFASRKGHQIGKLCMNTTYLKKKKLFKLKIFALFIRLVLNYARCVIQLPELVTFTKFDSRKIDLSSSPRAFCSSPTDMYLCIFTQRC